MWETVKTSAREIRKEEKPEEEEDGRS